MKRVDEQKQARIEAIMTAAPVIPVVVVDDPDNAVALGRALVAGGLPAIEITLRTARALECLAAVASDVEGAIPGAGTVLDPSQIAAAQTAGAAFMVSPGASPRLLEAAAVCDVPLLPGAATASEMMALRERGYRHLKFFPAMPAGGPAYLKSLASPLPDFRICPTGGVNLDNAAEFLAIPTVACVGGSWMIQAAAIAGRDWSAIEKLAAVAAALGR